MEVDTRLRALDEVITRLIVPIEKDFIAVKEDQSRAEYVNIVTQKDLLDWACGAGRWQAIVKSTIGPIATAYQPKGKSVIDGSMFGIILTLRIETADAGWIEQDGTGTESLTGSPVYGDFLTNAYAQALRRASESFGMARELWRRKIHPMQITASQSLDKVSGIPAVEEEGHPLEELAAEAEERTIIKAEIRALYTQMGIPNKATDAIDKLSMKPIEAYRIALSKVQDMAEQRKLKAVG